MNVTEYLQQVGELNKKITLDVEKLEAAKAALYGRAVPYNGDGVKNASKKNGFESALVRVAEYEEYIKSEIQVLTTLRFKIEREIYAVPDEKLAEILIRKYLLFQKWELIAEEMNYGVRHIYKLRLVALKAFYDTNKDLFINAECSTPEVLSIEPCAQKEDVVKAEMPKELKKAIKVLDSVIPPPTNKMVDMEHIAIAYAWEDIRRFLLAHYKNGGKDVE